MFLKDTGGDEFDQLYRYDVHTGLVTMLTDGGRSQTLDVSWNRRGDRLAYDSTRRNGADRDIYVMDPASPKTDRRVLQVEGGGWRVLSWSADDANLTFLKNTESYRRDLRRAEYGDERQPEMAAFFDRIAASPVELVGVFAYGSASATIDPGYWAPPIWTTTYCLPSCT